MINQWRRPSLLAIFAHPDDEAFGPAGTLARYADMNCHVALICATRGEAGRRHGSPPFCSQEQLGDVRENEMRAAARTLGLRELIFLGVPDKLLSSADQDWVVGQMVAHIRRLRPHVVITFGPDGSLSPHPDHKAIHRQATAAWHKAGQEGAYPEQVRSGLKPWRPRRLYYLDWGGATQVDVTDYRRHRLQAIRDHKTQTQQETWAWDNRAGLGQMRSTEGFTLAAGPGPDPLTDLFDGLEDLV